MLDTTNAFRVYIERYVFLCARVTGNQVHGAYEEDKLETQLQKLRDDLFAREPHLAELLLLDSIGASIDEQDLIPKQFV